MKGLEIGPYFSPLASKRNGYSCLSLDVFPTEELRRRAQADPNVPEDMISHIEEVDLVGTATENRPACDGEIWYGQSRLHHLVAQLRASAQPNKISAGMLRGTPPRWLSVDGDP
jgi:hypothetical protein